MNACRVALILIFAGTAVAGIGVESEESDQLERVRQRIGTLDERLSKLEAESTTRREERERLDAELELAEARVREIELILGRSRTEAERVAAQIADLTDDLQRHRELLEGHVQIAALLGRPGMLQLVFDGVRGGDLEGALNTIVVFTSGQVRLVEEYGSLQRRRSEQLAELSRVLSRATGEVDVLASRRRALEMTRRQVEDVIRRLDRSRRSASSELDELRQRERALKRLMTVLSDQPRFTGVDDIRQYRGALPWPASGLVVREFGRRYLPKYSTYTVCNGLWFDVASGAEVVAVFPGEVAYARFFKGYGNMVVIDHGHEVYSLAAGLATIHVRVNQRVNMGLRIGLASPKAEGGNTYFEIRVGKKPQDPRRWLQLEQ